jgi:hypothetical protein
MSQFFLLNLGRTGARHFSQEGSFETARCTGTRDHATYLSISPPLPGEWADCTLLRTLRNHQLSKCSLQACFFFSQGWGLIDLPLRAAFSPAHPRARRDVPLARARAFHPLYLSLGEWPRLPFTARIERAQFHRARSASKKGTWPLPSLSF